MGAEIDRSFGADRRGLPCAALVCGAWDVIGRVRISFRQMASRPAALAGFCRGSDAAGGFAGFVEVAGLPSAGVDGAIVAARVLRASAVLFRGAHADGQRVDAQRLAAIRAARRNARRDAADREDLLEERSEARTPAQTAADVQSSRSSRKSRTRFGD